jgi:hypothetical protein
MMAEGSWGKEQLLSFFMPNRIFFNSTRRSVATQKLKEDY